MEVAPRHLVICWQSFCWLCWSIPHRLDHSNVPWFSIDGRQTLGSAKQLPLQSLKEQTISTRNMLIWPVFVQSCSYFTFIYAYALSIPALLTLLNSVHLMLIYMRYVLPQQKSSCPTSTRLKHSSDQ